MIFTYWDGDISCLDDFIKDWSAVSRPVIYTDGDVIPILAAFDDTWPRIYSRIRIQSCKSDIARIALLYRHGGLYVDAHTGKPDLRMLVGLLGQLAEYDIALASSPHPEIPRVIQNGAILARKESGAVVAILSSIMENLLIEHEIVPRGGYNIATITGAWAIRMCLFRRDRTELVAHPQFSAATFAMEPEVPRPFRFYVHYGYRAPGAHWSERQAVEPLFDY